MRILFYVILAILVFLAVSSGVSKIMLMEQEVEFFGQYGFTDPVLIAFGVAQLLGGVLLLLPGTRIVGAIIVSVTFVVSAAVLAMEGNTPFALITLFCVGLLGYVIKLSLRTKTEKQS